MLTQQDLPGLLRRFLLQNPSRTPGQIHSHLSRCLCPAPDPWPGTAKALSTVGMVQENWNSQDFCISSLHLLSAPHIFSHLLTSFPSSLHLLSAPYIISHLLTSFPSSLHLFPAPCISPHKFLHHFPPPCIFSQLSSLGAFRSLLLLINPFPVLLQQHQAVPGTFCVIPSVCPSVTLAPGSEQLLLHAAG